VHGRALDRKKLLGQVGFDADPGVERLQPLEFGAPQVVRDDSVEPRGFHDRHAAARQGQEILHDGRRLLSRMLDRDDAPSQGTVLR